MGFYAAAAHLNLFSNLFAAAYPDDKLKQQYQKFQRQVSMPMNTNKISEVDFANLMHWAMHPNTPVAFLEDILAPDVNAPTSCQESSNPELTNISTAHAK